MSVSATAVEKFKSAMAEEQGRIQVMIQTKLKGYSGFALKETKETDYVTSDGENPLSIRYRKARMQHEDYQEFLVEGNEMRDYETASCSGDTEILTALSDKKVKTVETRGTTVHMGYDQFGRTPKRTAIESEIIDILSVIQKKAPGQYISHLREALIDSALERYERSVVKDLAKLAYHKTAVTKGTFRTTEGGEFFNQKPEGVLSIGMLKRLGDRLDSWNYSEGADTPMVDGTHLFRVYTGRNQAEQAIENYKKLRGYMHISPIYANDPKFGSTKVFDQFQFVVNKLPPRGYLKQVQGGDNPLYQFIEIYPTKNIVATGEGILEVPNNEYWDCVTYCEGAKQELVEMGFITHPQGMERQRFEIPIIDKMFSKMGAKYSGFDVRFLNDTLLWGHVKADDTRESIPNEDRLMAKMKINHSYAPFSMNAEKTAAFLVLASPDIVECFEPNCCDTEDSPTVSIEIPNKEAVKATDGNIGTEFQPVQRDYVGEGVGVIRMDACNVVVGKLASGLWAQTLSVCVRRVEGFDGTSTVSIATADDTAVAGVNYTAVAPTVLTWEDGCGGVQCVEVPILEAANAGLQFTATISSVNNSTLPADPPNDGCITTTIVLEADPDPEAENACTSC